MTTINPVGILFYEPYDKPLSSAVPGVVMPLAFRQFYLTGTTTPTNVYQDAFLTTPYSPTGQVTADSNGRFPLIYLDPTVTYRAQLFQTNGGAKLEDVDPISPAFQIVTGTFTMTTLNTDFSSPPSGTANYAIFFGRLVYLFVPPIGPSTSISTSFSLQGLPAAIQPQSTIPHTQIAGGATNNGAETPIQIDVLGAPSGGSINLLVGGSINGWTASGNKGFGVQTLIYWLF
jgi:hypothetical protein